MAKKKPVKNPKVARTRNAGTMTESEYWSRVRSALRKAFAAWRPAQQAMVAAENGQRINPKTGRLKKVYRCAICGESSFIEEMQKDHIEQCGSLRCADDIAGFLARLTCEDPSMFQVLHRACHQTKTNMSRKNRETQKPNT